MSKNKLCLLLPWQSHIKQWMSMKIWKEIWNTPGLSDLDTPILKIEFPFLIHSQIIIIALLQCSFK